MPKQNTKPSDYPQAVIKQIELLAQNIGIARKRRHETQTQWAKKLGVSQPTMARIERGDPSVAMASYVMCMWLINQASGLADLIAPQNDHASLEREVTKARSRGASASSASSAKAGISPAEKLASQFGGKTAAELAAQLGISPAEKLASQFGGKTAAELAAQLGISPAEKLASQFGGKTAAELAAQLGISPAEKLASQFGGKTAAELAAQLGISPAAARNTKTVAGLAALLSKAGLKSK